ncbi:MAG: DUF167 domain-containing protein [Patescibacteria group bacterium]|jgi:hypothetical protein
MTRFTVRIIPNASRSELVGFENSAWKIRLAAPPVDGKANEKLVRFLADLLDLSLSEIEIVKGQTSKTKLIEARCAPDDVMEKLKDASSKS